MGKVRINYSTFTLKDGGKGAIAVLIYSGPGNPKTALDWAVSTITDEIRFFELIDAHLDNPWMRVIITNINDMEQEDFNATRHKLTKIIEEATNNN